MYLCRLNPHQSQPARRKAAPLRDRCRPVKRVAGGGQPQLTRALCPPCSNEFNCAPRARKRAGERAGACPRALRRGTRRIGGWGSFSDFQRNGDCRLQAVFWKMNSRAGRGVYASRVRGRKKPVDFMGVTRGCFFKRRICAGELLFGNARTGAGVYVTGGWYVLEMLKSINWGFGVVLG